MAARPELLCRVLHTLLVAHGFKLLSRLMLAISGRMVQVALLPVCAGPVAPPRAQQGSGRTTYNMDPRWVARVSPDDAGFQQWCHALTGRPPSLTQAPGSTPVVRHLEPA